MEPQLMDAGCDAISCTAYEGTEAWHIMDALYFDQFRQERERGMDVNNISPSGYRGDQCGRVFFGRRANHTLYQARGDFAKAAADRLVQTDGALHTTRLDWQATFRPPITEREACKRYRGLIDNATARDRPQSAGRGIVYQARDMANSYNLVSNSRESYWRTYNKHRESPGEYPPGTWRHEWQIKGKRAVNSWAQFRQSRDQGSYSLAVLRGYLLKCGLDEPCLREVAPIAVTHGKRKSDTDKRLLWLEATAAAVVGKLLADGVRMEKIVRILAEANGVNGYFVER